MRKRSGKGGGWGGIAGLLAVCTGLWASVLGAGAEENPYAGLEKAGQVTYEYADWKRGSGTYPGLTTFHLGFKNSMILPRVAPGTVGQVRVLITNIVLTLKHEMRLPRGHTDEEAWYARLKRHEFDHVRISIDQRPRLLLNYLLSAVGRLEFQMSGGPTSDLRGVVGEVDAALKARHDAVMAVMRANYEYLDEVTDHGEKPLEDRVGFFNRLYKPERLAELKFPYLAEAGPLLKSQAYLRFGLIGETNSAATRGMASGSR